MRPQLASSLPLALLALILVLPGWPVRTEPVAGCLTSLPCEMTNAVPVIRPSFFFAEGIPLSLGLSDPGTEPGAKVDGFPAAPAGTDLLPADPGRVEPLPTGPVFFAFRPRGVARTAEGVWRLTGEGRLVAEGSDAPHEVPGAPVALCGIGELALVTAGSDLVLWTGAPGRWRERRHAPGRFALLDCSAKGPVLVTSAGIFSPGRAVRADLLDLVAPEGSPPPVTLRLGGALYIGSDAAAYGGGLDRLDLATGQLVPVQENWRAFTGLAPDPSAPGCLWVSARLMHLGARLGGIWHFCPGPELILRRVPEVADPQNGEWNGEVPICALAGDGISAWAVSPGRVWRLQDGAWSPLKAGELTGGRVEGAMILGAPASGRDCGEGVEILPDRLP